MRVGLKPDAFGSIQRMPSAWRPTHEARVMRVGLQPDAFGSIQRTPSA